MDWGDNTRQIFKGTTSSIASQAGLTKTYSAAGTYQVSITENVAGGFPKPFFDAFRNNDSNNDALKVRNIIRWGNVTFSDLAYSFSECRNLQIAATDHPTSKLNLVTDLNSAWYNCTNLTTFPQIDTSNVTNFNSTWYNCINITNFPLLNMNKMSDGFNCFFGMKLPTETYDQLLFNLSQNNFNTNVFFNAGERTTYSPSSQQYRDILTRPIAQGGRNWDIIDGGPSLGLNFTKQGQTQTARDQFNFFTNPARLNCGVGCNSTSVNFGLNEIVTLNYNAASTPSCLVPNVYYETSRAVQYTYAAGDGILLEGNGILNTGQLINLRISPDSGLIIQGIPSDGTPYDNGLGITITYREIVIDMSSAISVFANIRCS